MRIIIKIKDNFSWKRFFLLSFLLVLLFLIYFYFTVRILPPEVEDQTALAETRQTLDDHTFQVAQSWLQKNDYGLWEAYIEGTPFERGVRIGKLEETLIAEQEIAFIEGIQKLIPSDGYLSFLKYIVAWQNRHLSDYVAKEFQEEIYGMSFFANDDFDFIGPKFHRKLIYHAAHDIGHTMQNLGLVGCTSLAVWNEQSVDSSLILARNFDFYVGDAFAKNKVISFIRPNTGTPFMMVGWPGMIGCVSGMNLEGLAVTLNAGPPALPGSSKTPISILAREILQYATTIEEAFAIANSKEVFISENIVIASAKDNRVVVIEKTPEQAVLFKTLDNMLVCSNHFQSANLKDTEQNQNACTQTSTIHRMERMNELMKKNGPLDIQGCVDILRDRKGVGEEDIGLGNEMALNQMIAHHAVVFKPQERQVWVSTIPWQLGAFVAYDLEAIFNELTLKGKPIQLVEEAQVIPQDTFLNSNQFADFQQFRIQLKQLQKDIVTGKKWAEADLKNFEQLNPEHYLTYASLGTYYQVQEDCEKAADYFTIAVLKAIPWQRDREVILEKLKACVE